MNLLIEKSTNVVVAFGLTLRFQDNVYISENAIFADAAAYKLKTVEVEDLPEGIAPYTHCYTDAKGFFENAAAELMVPIEQQVLSFIQNADNKYKVLARNFEAVDIEDLRIAKIEQLKEACTEAIFAGFTSESTGHTFGFNDKDQSNFTQRMLTIVAGAAGPFKWKSADKGVVELTKAEFTSLINEAEAHKLEKQAQYWELEALVLAADTKEEIDSIIWA